MSVELEPSELGFRRPFTHEVSQLLRLTNPNEDTIAFKVKTTAPKQYCVRPNSGRIEPGKTVEIQVLLQAMKEDPPPEAKCRDKFLVQSVSLEGNPEGDISSVWSNIDKVAKEGIKEKKIRVTFLPASGTAGSSQDLNGTHHDDEAPPAYSPTSATLSPTTTATGREYETPTKSSGPTSSDNTPATAPNSAVPGDSKSGAQSTLSSTLATATSSISAGASSASTAVQQQLDKANETIKVLRAQVEEQGLRQRKTDAVAQDARERVTTGTTGMGVQSQPAEGVPVQIVAALCLLSFLVAYFFF